VSRRLNEAAVLVISGMRNLPLKLLGLEALLRHLRPVALVVSIKRARISHPARGNPPRSRKALWRLGVQGRRTGGAAGTLCFF
jgi:hypothetical protein